MTDNDPFRFCLSCAEKVHGLRYQATGPEAQIGALCERCHTWIESTDYERCISCGQIRHVTYVDRHPVNGRITCRDDAPFSCADHAPHREIRAAEAVCGDCECRVPALPEEDDWGGDLCDRCVVVARVRDLAEQKYAGPLVHVSDDDLLEAYRDHECDVLEAACSVSLREICREEEARDLAAARREDAEWPHDTYREMYDDTPDF